MAVEISETAVSRPSGAPTRAMNLRRLLAPHHVAVFGGKWAAEAVRQCLRIGFDGDIWPVHPRHDTVEGLRCYRDVAELPDAPDACFIAIPRQEAVEVIAALAQRGAGGAVCFTSGFAEVGGEGVALQRRLIEAAGDMAIIGPNCYGMLNFLDGAVLWPDQHGGKRVERGAAIITQSGNLGLNLTMQRRSLPMAYLITVGNKAGINTHDLIEALLDDNRINAIGLHIESLDNIDDFSRAAVKALKKGVPIVALKAGSSDLGAATTVSHTSSLAGRDDLYEALFRRLGIARVRDPAGLIETLKYLSIHGAASGRRLISASCSGGEATLVADLAQPRGLELPEIPSAARQRLQKVLGDRVSIANPLDYHTYIWGDSAAQTECFAAMMDCRFDAHLLVLDFPRDDRCTMTDWNTTLDAFVTARNDHGQTARASVVASMPEGMPEHIGERLLSDAIAPMQGVADCLDAIDSAARIGAARNRIAEITPLPTLPAKHTKPPRTLDEWTSKRELAEFGLPVPKGEITDPQNAPTVAERLGYPVVVKTVSETLTHKTEAGGVSLNLSNSNQVRHAVDTMRNLTDRFLVETMVQNPVVELIVGVQRDPLFGLALTLGAGGILVELIKDSVTLLLPASQDEVLAGLKSLRVYGLLTGYRDQPPGDMEALFSAIAAVTRYAGANRDRLQELDINPLLVLPRGRGVIAVDALVRVHDEDDTA